MDDANAQMLRIRCTRNGRANAQMLRMLTDAHMRCECTHAEDANQCTHAEEEDLVQLSNRARCFATVLSI